RGAAITFDVRTDSESFLLTTKDFQTLELNTFIPNLDNVKVGCGQDISADRVVITYKTSKDPRPNFRGSVVALEFVPKNFRLMTSEELNAPTEVTPTRRRLDAPTTSAPPSTSGTTSAPPSTSGAGSVDIDAMRRNAMMEQIRNNIRKPAAGEKQDF